MGKDRIAFIQGNEAIAEGAFASGAKFYAGYPITPSSEVAEMAARHLPALGGVFIQMEDEIGSIGAMLGASLTGAKSFTATSGPGFSLMQENLGVGIMAEIPCVIINVQRSGPSTGLATKPAQGDVMQARWGTHGEHSIIALSPSSVQECFDYMVTAFNFSEKYRTPVILLADEIVGHLRERVVLKDPESLDIWERKRPSGDPANHHPYKPDTDGIPPMGDVGGPYIQHANSSMHDETGFPNASPDNADRIIRRLYNKIEDNKDDLIITKEWHLDDAEIIMIAYGCSARSARESMEMARRQGKKVGLLQLITVWPFADKAVLRCIEQAKAVIVPELNLGQLIGEVQKLNCTSKPIIGIHKVNGEMITPKEIMAKIEEVSACL